MNDSPADVQPISLERTTAGEYCRAVQRATQVEFWWYMGGLVGKRNRWKPFEDSSGRWWWHVKPRFAWPVDFFSPIPDAASVHPSSGLLGWQHSVQPHEANSHVRLNVIQDLSGYKLEAIEGKKRRWTIRKALRELDYAVCDATDADVASQACEVWNSHVQRTGWNKPMTTDEFRRSWHELAAMPGTTVITARDRQSHALCAWLIGRVIDGTAFIDTLTSHTDRVAGGPNDGLVFLYLISAAAMGIRHAHYGLHSKIESLESFKKGLGFTPHAFPTRLHLRFPVGPLLRILRPRDYKRLLGDENWST